MWVVGGLCALALVGMALWGDDRTGSLAEHLPSGVMKDTLPGLARQIELTAPGRKTLRFIRAGASQSWAINSSYAEEGQEAKRPAENRLNNKLNELLMLLHNATPDRTFDAADNDLATYGLLANQVLRVTVATTLGGNVPLVLNIELGGQNPMGISNYARLVPFQAGQPEVFLLPAYVAQAVAGFWREPEN